MGTFDPDSVSNGSFNINGGRADEYVVMIDGAVATRTRSSGSMLGAVDVDTVQEVQVLTTDYSAEYGRSSAGQIRFVTKSGTRDFHGDLVENFRNSALDANTWTRKHSTIPSVSSGPAPYRFNQYGFDIGGPGRIGMSRSALKLHGKLGVQLMYLPEGKDLDNISHHDFQRCFAGREQYQGESKGERR